MPLIGGGGGESVSGDEKRYRAGGRMAAVWTVLRGDERGVPFNVNGMRMADGSFQMDGAGARQITHLGDLKLKKIIEEGFPEDGKRAGSRRGGPELPRGSTVRGCRLPGYVRGGGRDSGELPVSGPVGGISAGVWHDSELLLVSKKQLVEQKGFEVSFSVAFDVDFGEWATTLAEASTKVQSGKPGGGYRRRTGGSSNQIPLPVFTQLWGMLQAQSTVAEMGGDQRGGGGADSSSSGPGHGRHGPVSGAE